MEVFQFDETSFAESGKTVQFKQKLLEAFKNNQLSFAEFDQIYIAELKVVQFDKTLLAELLETV